MITSTQMYWITRLDSFNGFLLGCVLFCIVGFLAATLAYTIFKCFQYDCRGSDLDEAKKLARTAGNFSIILMFLALSLGLARCFTPTTKEMAAILVIPAIANNKNIQNEGKEIYDLAKEYLKKQTEKPTEQGT